jgi:hypothetical protein
MKPVNCLVALLRLTVVVILVTSAAAYAAQDAIVIADEAPIFSDRQMSSPIGFVVRGRRLRIGVIPRNNAQVYPVIVSGRVAYIRVVDVSTEREQLASNQLATERFFKASETRVTTSYALSYFAYRSQISWEHANGQLGDKAIVNWHGVNLKGEILVRDRWEFSVHSNFLSGFRQSEGFRMFEIGPGANFRLIDSKRLQLKWESQLLPVPFANYQLGQEFRVNSFGLSLGTGLNLYLRLGEHLGLEAFSGVYYTQLRPFKVPAPYQSVAPSFYGMRTGLGLNYRY